MLERRTTEDIFAAIEFDLTDVQVLRLVEPEWLDALPGREQLLAIVDAFRARGGRVEHARPPA